MKDLTEGLDFTYILPRPVRTTTAFPLEFFSALWKTSKGRDLEVAVLTKVTEAAYEGKEDTVPERFV